MIPLQYLYAGKHAPSEKHIYSFTKHDEFCGSAVKIYDTQL